MVQLTTGSKVKALAVAGLLSVTLTGCGDVVRGFAPPAATTLNLPDGRTVVCVMAGPLGGGIQAIDCDWENAS